MITCCIALENDLLREDIEKNTDKKKEYMDKAVRNLTGKNAHRKLPFHRKSM